MSELKDCGACGAAPGELHGAVGSLPGCLREQCPGCGHVMGGCQGYDACEEELERIPHSGRYPGQVEAAQWGWFTRETAPYVAPDGHLGHGWERCSRGDPGATPDVSRLVVEAVWDRSQQRFVKSVE